MDLGSPMPMDGVMISLCVDGSGDVDDSSIKVETFS